MREKPRSLEVRRWALRPLIVAATVLLGTVVSCLPGPCGTVGDSLVLTGKIVDGETLTGLSDVVVGARSLTGDEETDATRFAQGIGPFPAEDGSFELRFVVLQTFCSTAFGPRIPAFSGFPRPDQVEVIVLRGVCEERFMIDINSDTVVDLDFPDDVIELKDPILVPPCAQDESGE